MLRRYLVFRDADAGPNGGESDVEKNNTGGDQDFSKAPAAAKPPTLMGQATDEQIAAWKAKYKMGIFAYEINGQIAYFKNPSRQEINCALYKADAESPLSACEELASLIYIPDQPNTTILTDDEVYSGLMICMKLKLNGIPGRLVNL
jgi:hypothetical protein